MIDRKGNGELTGAVTFVRDFYLPLTKDETRLGLDADLIVIIRSVPVDVLLAV